MLARIASETWQTDPAATIFINGDGERFRYVLDYLRKGSISLPLTVPKQAILTDLEYYGFENVNPNEIDGWGNASFEAALHIRKKKAKKRELVEDIDMKIETLKLGKSFVLIAHGCFEYCYSGTGGMEDIVLAQTADTGIHNDLRYAFDERFDEELFNKHLAEYGLYHINHGPILFNYNGFEYAFSEPFDEELFNKHLAESLSYQSRAISCSQYGL
jgi:hypothetical protein